MTNKKRLRIRQHAAKTGMTYQAAHNAIASAASGSADRGMQPLSAPPDFNPRVRSWPTPRGLPFALTKPERDLADQLHTYFARMKDVVSRGSTFPPALLDDAADCAHSLHQMLADRGREPRHTSIMVENRRCKPREREFYRHMHSVEDLLRVLQDENANNDAVDVALNVEFTFHVYSRRWGHKDRYTVHRTARGWKFAHIDQVETGKDARVAGQPGTGLLRFLEADTINYPADLPGYFDWLWSQAESGLSVEQIQDGISDLADWVSECERLTPAKLFRHYG